MTETAELIRVRGLVQGVGFRPTLWRLRAPASGCEVGWPMMVKGCASYVCGPASAVEGFVLDLSGESPPLARIDRIERESASPLPWDAGFHIAESESTAVGTGVAPDAATCAECARERSIPSPGASGIRLPTARTAVRGSPLS